MAGAQQITGAASMFIALEGAAPAAIGDLVTQDYLSSIPTAEFAEGGNWTLNANTLTASVASAEVCAALEADGGDLYGCEVVTIAANDGPDGVNGTADDVEASTGNVFTFKY